MVAINLNTTELSWATSMENLISVDSVLGITFSPTLAYNSIDGFFLLLYWKFAVFKAVGKNLWLSNKFRGVVWPC